MTRKRTRKKTTHTNYYYKPRSYRSKEDIYWYRRFAIITGLILVLLAIFWFFGITLLANLDEFWSTFRRAEDEPVARQDTIPPLPPKINSIPQATNKASLNISGFSEPGSKVKIYLNDTLYTSVLADKEGAFTFEEIGLRKGKNYIYTTATDSAGNESNSSKTYTITFDKKAPEIHIEEPEDGQEFVKKDEKTVKIAGTVSKNATLTINETKGILNNDGEFTFYLTLEEGENTIRFKAVDDAGNKTEEEITVTYTPEEDKKTKE